MEGLASRPERDPRSAARRNPAAREAVQREQEPRRAAGRLSLLSASNPGHGRRPFLIGAASPSLEIRSQGVDSATPHRGRVGFAHAAVLTRS